MICRPTQHPWAQNHVGTCASPPTAFTTVLLLLRSAYHCRGAPNLGPGEEILIWLSRHLTEGDPPCTCTFGPRLSKSSVEIGSRARCRCGSHDVLPVVLNCYDMHYSRLHQFFQT